MKLKAILLVTVFITLTILSACTGKSGETVKPNDSSADTKKTAESNPDGKYDPPITVTMVRDNPGGAEFPKGDSLDNNIWTRLLTETYGINIKNSWVTDGAGYSEKLNVAIASNDLPDIYRVSPSQLKQLVEAGMVADLTNVYKNNVAPLTDKKLKEDNGIGLKSAQFDGKLMAMPYITASIDSAPMLFIRRDWLNNLGLSEPKTMEDVFKISQAFKNDDPDKNGKADTFGIGFSKDIFGGFSGMLGLFNSFHAYNIWVNDPRASGVVLGTVQPEMKPVLTKLQQMYKSGEIDKEFAVKSAAQVLSDIINGKIGMVYGVMSTPLSQISQSMAKDPKADWYMYPLQSIDAKPARPQLSSIAPSMYWVVNKNSKNPAALVKMMNLYAEKTFGKTADFKYNYDGDFQSFKYQDVKTYGGRKNLDHHLAIKKALQGDPSDLNPEGKGYFEQVKQYMAGDKTMWKYDVIFGPKGTQSVVDMYVKGNLNYPNQFYGIPTNLMTDRGSTLTDLTNEAFMKTILGAPVDETFDKFVTDWNKLGGKEITKEVNDWYVKQK